MMTVFFSVHRSGLGPEPPRQEERMSDMIVLASRRKLLCAETEMAEPAQTEAVTDKSSHLPSERYLFSQYYMFLFMHIQSCHVLFGVFFCVEITASLSMKSSITYHHKCTCCGYNNQFIVACFNQKQITN